MDRPHALAAALAFVLLAAAPSGAATLAVSGVALAPGAGLSPDDGGSAGQQTSLSAPDGSPGNPLGATGVLDAGGVDADAGVGDAVTAATRVAAAVWTGLGTQEATFAYRLAFDVSADPELIYDVRLTHDLEGVLETASPGFLNFCFGCAASASDVTASLASGHAATGALVQAVAASAGGNEETNLAAAPATFTLAGLRGDQHVVVDFLWTASASAGLFDEAAVRFGLQPEGGAAYDDPVGSGPGDGHFVGVAAVVTGIDPGAVAAPEPAPGALGLLAAAGLAAVRVRRP